MLDLRFDFSMPKSPRGLILRSFGWNWSDFQNFAQGLDFLRFQVAIYTVFHEESESEVEKCKILEPGGKIWKKIQGLNFLSKNFLFKF